MCNAAVIKLTLFNSRSAKGFRDLRCKVFNPLRRSTTLNIIYMSRDDCGGTTLRIIEYIHTIIMQQGTPTLLFEPLVQTQTPQSRCVVETIRCLNQSQTVSQTHRGVESFAGRVLQMLPSIRWW